MDKTISRRTSLFEAAVTLSFFTAITATATIMWTLASSWPG
jgi:hypothetical protein